MSQGHSRGRPHTKERQKPKGGAGMMAGAMNSGPKETVGCGRNRRAAVWAAISSTVQQWRSGSQSLGWNGCFTKLPDCFECTVEITFSSALFSDIRFTMKLAREYRIACGRTSCWMCQQLVLLE